MRLPASAGGDAATTCQQLVPRGSTFIVVPKTYIAAIRARPAFEAAMFDTAFVTTFNSLKNAPEVNVKAEPARLTNVKHTI